MLKNDILKVLTIRDITNYYGIKINNNMCKCPFGHKDNSPSMKIYDKTNTFYCFACHKSGDFIKMVQLLFNLNFQQAMEKINDDFKLGLNTKSSYNKEQIIKLEKQKQLKKMQEEEQKQKENAIFEKLCSRRLLYQKLINDYKKQITIFNWEDLTTTISYLQNKIGFIDICIYDKFQIN